MENVFERLLDLSTRFWSHVISLGERLMTRVRIKTRPRKQWEVGRAFNLRMRRRFSEQGLALQ
jgi:hypothetical protein